MEQAPNLLDWYWDLPIVTRTYFTCCVALTAACALDIVTPYSLYYNWHAISQLGEVWRLVTNFMFFGNLGVDFLFHMFFLTRYCRTLEESTYAGRSVDFAFVLFLGCVIFMAFAPFMSMIFYGSSLSFMLVYLWGRRNPGMQIALLGLVGFSAPYLPFALLGISLLLGHDPTSDLFGIAVGHLLYFLEDVWPMIAEVRGWRIKRVLPMPSFILSAYESWRNRRLETLERATDDIPTPDQHVFVEENRDGLPGDERPIFGQHEHDSLEAHAEHGDVAGTDPVSRSEDGGQDEDTMHTDGEVDVEAEDDSVRIEGAQGNIRLPARDNLTLRRTARAESNA